MEQLPGQWKNEHIEVETISLKSIAHLGDAVYELYIRRKAIFLAPKIDQLHKLTTSLVNSYFHAELLNYLKPYFTEAEGVILKRARNLSVTSSKRKDQTVHRLSTSFEALIGYLYLTDNNRLEEIFGLIDKYIEKKLL